MKVGDRFRSRRGTGKHVAVVIDIHDGRVYLRHINRRFTTPKEPHASMFFDLPLWFFNSPSCGWTRDR